MLSTIILNIGMTLKMHFIPCEENEYHPRVLHGKRVAAYVLFLVLVKVFLFGYALIIPFEAFTAPDVLAAQADRIVMLTNDFRREKGLPALERVDALNRSADARAVDMASTGYLSNVSPTGEHFSSGIERVGYSYAFAGENVAMGFAEPIDVVDAWIRSQTNLINLAERGFSEIGIGVRAGTYEGKPTIFIVEHFGAPQGAITKEDQSTFIAAWPSQAVPGKTDTMLDAATGPVYDRARSRVSWEDNGEGKTKITVRAAVAGGISAVSALVQGYPIDLTPDIGDAEMYVGSIFVTGSADQVFKSIVASAITVQGKDGSVIRDSIDFEHSDRRAMTSWEKYRSARSWFQPVLSVFSVAYWMYFAYFMLYGVSLLLTVFIEYKNQHPQVVFRTIGFLGLIALLWLV